MNPSAAVHSSRLRRVLLVVLLVIGTVLGLLLAHADDTHRVVETSASVAHLHNGEASAAWWDGDAAPTAGSPESAPLEDALALCLTVASCFVVLLLAVLGVRRLPVTDADGRLVGVLAADDLIALLAEEMSGLAAMLSREEKQERATRKGAYA